MTPEDATVELTPDGSHTAFSTRYGEHYHNRNGAASQSRHVFLEGSGTHLHAAPRVLEIGFGLGLNFLTTLANVEERGVTLDYRAIEFDPQPRELLMQIASAAPGAAHPLWRALMTVWPHDADELEVAGKHLAVDIGDATRLALPQGWASAIYLDGFSPAVNPELWSDSFIARLAEALTPGGWIVTYSAAGDVRRALATAGLVVERRESIAGKREFLAAQRPTNSPTPQSVP
jgi:tRNA U34 5-methylaminomethyl-2-thiouridine-forming methyltransferase MnmC